MFAVCVALKIRAQDQAHFLKEMQANARNSLEREPDCHRFDVLTDPDRPGDVFLYELYSDAAAFDAHLASDHFRAFDQTTQSMIEHKSVQTWTKVVS